MANEFETALKNAATSVARYVQDASEMMVETKYVDVSDTGTPDFAAARPVARTIIRLDGDSEVIVPIRQSGSGTPDVDLSLFDLHQQNVATTIEYRARILNALLSTLVNRGR
jgi:hypothetical protein